MTEILFYILKESAESRPAFACRLAEQLWKKGKKVLIHTENAAQSTVIDQLLWDFRADSFVPHQVLEASEIPPVQQVFISHLDSPPPQLMDVLINLNPKQPLFFSQFEKLAEIIDADPSVKQHGRLRYKFYQERGYPIETYNQ
ncbi:DNA polymerase III chi subunit [Methylophaga frappieri]|uniref:DNA polymerase III chi subunit n=1 Tax=Methylophaga frappieri (strain ATCC BAA-2434 / DSM 25690 / JAM7) TaxID=754477 RepID=I1YL32_METFJ|nr:DNA polymerase III subunit chi [Methylophaga frappieri]AFJ03625.1 DNA polymerase III chi subunit [Methylophaga frappieri]